MGNILTDERAGSASPQQIERLEKAAKNARLNRAWLVGLAQAQRNERRHEERTRDLPPLRHVAELSRFEASDLIARIELGDADALRVCLRCARIGLRPKYPCVHDRTDFDVSRTAEIEYDR